MAWASPTSNVGRASKSTVAPACGERPGGVLDRADHGVVDGARSGWSSHTATRRPASDVGGAGSASRYPSSRSGPAVTLRARARSSAERASGPMTEIGPSLTSSSLERLAPLGHDAVRRLVPVDAVVGGRVADAAADVAAVLEARQTGGQRRPPTRPTTRPAPRVEVPRVVRRAVDVVVGLEVGERHRHVRLAEDHGAGGAQAGHDHGVLGGDVAGELGEAPRRRLAGDVEALLDRHRHAVQRADRRCPLASARSAARASFERPLAVVDDDGVDRRVQPVDALEVAAQQLDRRHRARAHGPGELAGRSERERGQRLDGLRNLGHHAPPRAR